MLGPEAAANAIAKLLEGNVPTKIVALRARLGLAVDDLESPREYLAHDEPELALDRWPAVLVVPQGMSSIQLVDVVDGASVYECTYQLRTFVFYREQDFTATARGRDRLTLAVREVILESLSAGTSGARIDPTSLRESYSETDREDARTIAGAYVDLDLTLTESLAPEIIGQVETAVPQVTAIISTGGDDE
ncbi:MAG TPA: hypothetical protein VM600_03225 [Actinomycetota bacterium]|nr:hypothetical protein [Actinomycetota bacterium]